MTDAIDRATEDEVRQLARDLGRDANKFLLDLARISDPKPPSMGRAVADATGVWWDPNWSYYGWTCPRCRCSGINHQSVQLARFSFAEHYCPRDVSQTFTSVDAVPDASLSAPTAQSTEVQP